MDIHLQEGRPADEKTHWSGMVRSVHEPAFWDQPGCVKMFDHVAIPANSVLSVVYYLPSALSQFVELPRSTTLLIAGFIQL